MSAYRIVALPGDGTGREVMTEALKVLDVFQKNGNVELKLGLFHAAGNTT